MKRVLYVLFVLILLVFCLGYILKGIYADIILGERIIGVGVLLLAFVFMPLFLYHRWKGKRWKDYTFTEENMAKMKEK